MKRVKYISMMASAAVLMTAVAGGAMAAAPTSNIASTKHNLSSSGTADNKTTGTTEICVFCHTPHGADTSQSVPLWNRALNAPASYTTYASLGSATLDGTIAEVGSVSMACLSCHDGTIAMDSLLNAPGSGAGTVTDPAVGLGWTFTSTSGTMTAAGLLTSGIASIGEDLSNDHPVGILYAGGNVVGNEASPASFTDPDFKAVKSVVINSGTYWYVDVDSNSKRTRTDMILYSRTNATEATSAATIAGTQPYVECASCHDPHVEAVDANQVMFLRMTNAGSALCLACHAK